MSNRLGDVEARISTVRELDSVVGAMRGIAAARSREARERLDGIRACAATIGASIGDALLLDEDQSAIEPRQHDGDSEETLIVVCAEQGFVGSFNEHLIDAVAQHLPRGGASCFVIGDRGVAIAAARGLRIAWSAPMVSHADEIGALADRITAALYERLEAGEANRVTLLHAVPQLSAQIEIARTSVLPFDFTRFSQPARGRAAPLVTLPVARLLAKLAEEYVYTQLCEALMLSFAAENEARMRAMITARTHVEETLDQLTGDFRRLRQEAITAEIVELSSGNLAAREAVRRTHAARSDMTPDAGSITTPHRHDEAAQ